MCRDNPVWYFGHCLCAVPLAHPPTSRPVMWCSWCRPDSCPACCCMVCSLTAGALVRWRMTCCVAGRPLQLMRTSRVTKKPRQSCMRWVAPQPGGHLTSWQCSAAGGRLHSAHKCALLQHTRASGVRLQPHCWFRQFMTVCIRRACLARIMIVLVAGQQKRQQTCDTAHKLAWRVQWLALCSKG